MLVYQPCQAFSFLFLFLKLRAVVIDGELAAAFLVVMVVFPLSHVLQHIVSTIFQHLVFFMPDENLFF